MTAPAAMAATIAEVDPMRVTVPALDGGLTKRLAFGGNGLDVGDECRVVLDVAGFLVVVAPAAAGGVGPAGPVNEAITELSRQLNDALERIATLEAA